ncbi:MAG: hypothetical protein KF715_16970 [Candidatus Didemnitutus sp.]|nr:hypothetical protein [Candidatus Didemnitutus sp.]
MNSSAESTRVWKVRLGWIVLLLVIGAPLSFFYLTTPKERETLPEAPREKHPPTKLESVGLRDYRDWDGLPEIFAVWADRAHWKNDRTRFSYWNPGTSTYSYFFEARRTANGYRFREIPEPRDTGFQWDPDAADDTPLRLYLPIRARLEDPVQPPRDTPERPKLKPAPKDGSPRPLEPGPGG